MTTSRSADRSTQPTTNAFIAAARTARTSGVVVQVVLQRAPGVVAQLRRVAEQEQVDVTIELIGSGIISYFGVPSLESRPEGG